MTGCCWDNTPKKGQLRKITLIIKILKQTDFEHMIKIQTLCPVCFLRPDITDRFSMQNVRDLFFTGDFFVRIFFVLY